MALSFDSLNAINKSSDTSVGQQFLQDLDIYARSTYMQGNYGVYTAVLKLPTDVNGSSFYFISSDNTLVLNLSGSEIPQEFSVPIKPLFINTLDHGNAVKLRFYVQHGVVKITEVT